MERDVLYRLLLRLLPDATRRRHGDQMAVVFAEQVRDARRRCGRLGAWRAMATETVGLVRFAWNERRAAPRRPRLDDGAFAAPTESTGSRSMFTALAQDLRYAARLLRASPGFTLVCVATMALAVGANTAIFSVVNSVLLRALPFADPDAVVVLGHRTGGADALDTTTPGNLYDWMAGATAFESMAGFAQTERIVTANGTAERLRGGLSVGSLFDVLGREAADGRTLRVSDDDPGADPVVVLSAGLSRRLFGEARSVGQSIAINSVPHTIVGVMPADFAFFDYDYEYWVPARFDTAFRANRDQYFLLGIARLDAGVARAQADAQLNTVMDAIRAAHPRYTQNAIAVVLPVKDVLLDGTESRLLLLQGAVGFVLLIACANLGNLLLARASTRRPEMALRHALGAGQARLARQMIAESLLLALIGGVAGLAAGAGLLRVLLTYLPDTLPRFGGISLDGTTLLFTLGVSVVAGLFFGAFPALQLAGRAPLPSLRDGARGSRRTGVVRASLVASELALALMLLVGAGLLVRSLSALLEVSPGFRSDSLLTFSASVPTATYRTAADRVAFFERAATALEAVPGVRGVTMTTTLPVAGRGNGAWFNLVDRPLPPDQTPPGLPNRVVRINYFEALGIPLLEGRGFTTADGLDGTRAVIVSRSVARRFFGSDSPIGRRIYMGAPDNRVIPDSEIVGVVDDVKQVGLDEERPETVYAPHALVPTISSFTFALRTSTTPTSLAPAVRDAMRQLDPGVPLIRLQTMDDVLNRATAPARSSMVLVTLFAGVALALAVIGVFGVLSYAVTQQTTEIGIRLALGASRRSVHRLVLRQGLTPVTVGLVVGLLGAIGLTRFMTSMLYGVTPTDPVTFAAVAALLVTTAGVAASIPARRATRVDPVRILRGEG